jgi:antitoxin component YwqK of YwqJK toxin-antitoxin module
VSYLAGALQSLTVLNAQGALVRSEALHREAGQPVRRIKRVYYPSGQLRSETDLLEPEPTAKPTGREGVGREWAESGQLTQETRWAVGLERSIQQWYLNGQPKVRQNIAREGRVELRTTESFWDNGNPSAMSVERNGRLWGWQRYFNEAGLLLHEDEHGERGVLLRRKHFNAQGALEREERFLEDGSRI